MALDLAAVPAPETPGADGAARSRLPAGGCEESEAAATGPHWLVPPAVEPGRRAAPNSTENSAGAARAAAAEHEARHGGGGAQPHADGDPAPSAAAADRAAAAAAGDAALASDATGETAAAAVAVLAAPEPMAVDPAEASADVAQAQAARRAWAAAAAARPAARAAAAAAAAAPGACPRQPPPRPPLVVPATALAYIGRVQRALRLGAFLATASGQRWPPAPPAPPLLPPPAPGAPPPLLTVLFDLDGTLVLRVQRPPWPGGGAAARAAFRGWGGARDVVVRPKAAAFLSACASRGWRLAVFTAASEGYARDVLASLLDPSGALFGGEGEGAEGTDGEGEGAPSPRPLLLLSWSSVTRLPCGDGGYLRGEDGKPYESYAKDVAAAGAGAAAVLVDDTPRVAALSPHSVLLVRPWDGADGGDDELMGRALPLLDACAAAEAAGAAAAAAAAAGAGGGDGGAAAFRPGDGVAAVLRARFGLRERGERAAEAAERARGARCAAAADRARMHLLLLRLRQQQREAAAAAGGAKRPRRAPLAAPPPAISGDGEAAPFAFVDPSPREVCAAAARAPFSPFSPEELRWEGWRAAPPGGGAAA